MRLFLLPISTRRSLLYCEKLHEKPPNERNIFDKVSIKANETWAAWEKDEKALLNWKKKVTFYGNQALKRIPYEEWGLKTMPALTAKRKQAILEGREKYQVIFPRMYLHENKIPGILKQLATERQGMHRSRLIWSVVIMPFTAPFMLIPVIPNLPFFYVLYRAYSHWKAYSGSKHLEFLLNNNTPPTPNPSLELDEVYTAGLMYPTREISRAAPLPTKEQAEEVAKAVEQQTNDGTEDVMLLQRWNGKLIAERFKLPDMEVEIERAVEQVEKDIKAKEELIEEKLELERATAKSGDTAKDDLPKEVLVHVKKAEKAGKEIHEKAKEVAGDVKDSKNRATTKGDVPEEVIASIKKTEEAEKEKHETAEESEQKATGKSEPLKEVKEMGRGS